MAAGADSEPEAGAYLDRLIELRLRDVARSPAPPQIPSTPSLGGPSMVSPAVSAPSVGAPINVEAHRAAMKQALGENFLGACQQKMTAAQIKCVLAANDSAAANACSSSGSWASARPAT